MEKKISDLRKFVAPEFLYGVGAAELAAQYAGNYDLKHCLVVTDPGVYNTGFVEPILADLAAVGIQTTIFDDISPNPRDYQVMSGVEIYNAKGCDSILAIGGGSPMDCAKGIGIVSSNDRHILDFEGVDNVPIPGPPLICLPTTSGSSADVSQFAIITDSTRHVKIAIVSKTTVPDVALIDPRLTTTMGAALTSATGMDALTHAIEAYVSTANSQVTDMFALQAMELVRDNLLPTIENLDDLYYRQQMSLASMNAGLAFSNAILGAVHAMAHSLGGLVDAPHGDCNGLLLPFVIEANFDYAQERYEKIAKIFGLPEGEHGAAALQFLKETITDLNKRSGGVMRLRDLNVREEDIPAFAGTALNDPCMLTNPKPLTEQEVADIYAKAY